MVIGLLNNENSQNLSQSRSINNDKKAGLPQSGTQDSNRSTFNKIYQNQVTTSQIDKDILTSKTEPFSSMQEAIDFVHKYGFEAYLEKLREDKIEEIKEKVLKSMGLTEEDFQKLPVEQQNSIEDIIKAKVQLASEKMLNKAKEDSKGGFDKLGMF